MHECVGASQDYHGVYRAAQTVLSRCCHVLVIVHAGASQGYVLGIPLYPAGRSSTSTGPFGLGLGLGFGLGLAHSCMYCDQPSLLTLDPGGGVNKKIPHRWGK